MDSSEGGFRIESDSMGYVKVPIDVYYGAQTQRAVENFLISKLRFQRRFIKALGVVKQAAALANMRLGLMDREKGEAVVKASIEVAEGVFDDQFCVDVFQTGSGTSTNMNANEVIANRAAELLGGARGDIRLIHPNDDVNMSQSTNDVFPTAIHISALEAIEEELLPSLKALKDILEAKASEFKDVVKAGRTHLQDAVPITLGQEFSGYASMIEHGIRRIDATKTSLRELPLGGTAVGTGLNAHPRFADLAIKEINRLTGLGFKKAENTFEALQSRDAAVEVSGALRMVAVSLMKICNDLRLLYSGPRTGLGEISLPAVQPGSSIMPGKVNPVIPEAVSMAAAKIIGNDLTVTISAQNGNLELNTMMPIIAYTLLESIEVEANAAKALAEKCVAGIKAKKDVCKRYAENSIALITVLTPVIGYDHAARLAKKALEEGRSIRDLILDEKILPEDRVDDLLDLTKLTKGGRAAPDRG